MSTSPPAGFTALTDPGAFVEHIGPVLAHTDGDLGLQADDRHGNRSGQVMGGALSTLADVAFSEAIRHDLNGERAVATVSLAVDFLRPAPAGSWLQATTRVERLGGSLAFADCSIRADGEEVVRARAVFAVRGGD